MKNLFVLILILNFQSAFNQVFDIDTIQYNGSIDNRINLVILPDGYQSNELSKFKTDAENFSLGFFDERPYFEYQNYFNVFIINVPSNESGANHPRTNNIGHDMDGYHPSLTVDNYFGSTFDYKGVHRRLFPEDTIAVENVLQSNFSSYDMVLVLVNTEYYGGSGSEFTTISSDHSAIELGIHEFGHSFVNLADEYYAGDYYAEERINMTKTNYPNLIKWRNWLNVNGVGIYQHHGGGEATNWYHPSENCKMMSLDAPLCSVCIEGTIEKIHSLVSPIDLYSPTNSDNIKLKNPTEFSIELNDPNPNTLKIEWSLNGSIIYNDVETVLIDPNQLISGENTIQVQVEDTSTLLKIDKHESIHIYSVLWTIDLSLGFDEVTEERIKIQISPNPTSDLINIDLDDRIGENIDVKVFSMMGQEVVNEFQNLTSESIQLNLDGLKTGIYIIQIRLSSGHIISKRIIKK